jgi:hypothetical protein
MIRTMPSRSISKQAAPLIALLALLAGACSSDAATAPAGPPAPTGGWLTVQLSTPRTDDGAVQLSVAGPAIDSIAIIGYDGFATHTTTGGDLVATGTIVSGDLARIHVPDLARTTEYQVVVTAAAARDTYALQQLSGYRAVLVR